MECTGPQVIKESFNMCDEAGTYLWLANIRNQCDWGHLSGDGDVAGKAQCYSAAVTGCSASVAPPVWSQPGESYRSWLCWNIDTTIRNGIEVLNFSRLTGTAVYKNAQGQCVNSGGLPYGIVAMRSRELGCQPGWTRMDVPGGYQCRRPAMLALAISLSGIGEIRPASTGGVFTSVLTAKVMENGRPKEGVGVGFSVDVTPNSGGHEHHNANRPKGSLSVTQGTTNANGEVRLTFVAPEVAGIHTVKATCATCSNSPAVKEVQVKVPSLVEMLADTKLPPSYTMVGQTGNHSSNHWLTSGSVVTLGKVTEAMFKSGWGAVGVNDGSLVWGGLFDIKGAWTPSHHEHRTGSEVDLSVTNPRSITSVQKKKTYAELCKKENTAFSIQTLWHQDDGYPEHFHMYLDGAGLTREAAGGPCCARYKTTRVKKDKNGAPVLDKNGVPVQEIVALCEETTPR